MNPDQLILQPTFASSKRERLLNYDSYVAKVSDLMMRIPRTTNRLSDPEWIANKDTGTLMMMTWGRAAYSLDLIALQYSAGAPIEVLRALFVEAMDHFEEYAKFSARYNEERGEDEQSPHIPLGDVEFDKANRLVCFSILLGLEVMLERVAALIDYNCIAADAMLEKFFSLYMERNSEARECTRHLPYFKTIRIFEAPTQERAKLLSEYIADWYSASRREPYYDSHKQADVFRGYWSWEAGAISVALDIDDTSFRDAEFYPQDLVDFAREAKQIYSPPGAVHIGSNELRAKAGDPCPKTGTWQSLDIPPTTRHFEAHEPMTNLDSAYGLTVWKLTL